MTPMSTQSPLRLGQPLLCGRCSGKWPDRH
jgi:hypothetical protein